VRGKEPFYDVYGCTVNDGHLLACTFFNGEQFGVTTALRTTLKNGLAARDSVDPTAYADATYAYGLNNLRDIVWGVSGPLPNGQWGTRGWAHAGWTEHPEGSHGTDYFFDDPCGGDTIVRHINDQQRISVRIMP